MLRTYTKTFDFPTENTTGLFKGVFHIVEHLMTLHVGLRRHTLVVALEPA